MAMPKQREGESDTDFAARLDHARKVKRESARKWREANRESTRKSARKWREAHKEAAKESQRRWREANKEAARESARRWREANKEATVEYRRKRTEARVLASAKGKPLTSNFTRARRPKMLTKLIIKVAEDFCRNYGFPLECKLDADVLKHAAETIRNSPELDGAANPWYGTDYLCPGVLGETCWAKNFRRTWRDRV